MPRSRIIFLLIIAAAIAIVLAAQIVPRLPAGPTPTPRPALEVQVAVNPMAYDWAAEQAIRFNAQNPQVDGQPFQVRVVQQEGIDIWQSSGPWTSARHPV